MSKQRPLTYTPNSTSYFERIRHLGLGVFLDSGFPKSRRGRFDIISAGPVELLELNVEDAQEPFEALQELYNKYQLSIKENPDLPFQGGIIGHFTYDLGKSMESIPKRAAKFSQLPDLRVGVYLWAIVVDHQQQKTTLVATAQVDEKLLDDLEALLISASSTQDSEFHLLDDFKSSMTAQEYANKLAVIADYIQAGDCYQVNFTQRFKSQFSGDPWHAYRQLRNVAPTPYSAFLDSPEQHILSLSPEQFLEIKNQRVTTKPIKGTRPRSKDPIKDTQLKQELLASEKDRAENLMIVDLLRNDLSKVCQLHSVKVPKLFDLESYANVHHIVSTVTARLAPNSSSIALLKHCFPGGSITGAPKIRAMQIIEELEPQQRSIYCGSIGYMSFCGRMDSSITIRTLLCEQNNIYCWAGGGIVADSDVAGEYQEAFNKINNLIEILEETKL